MDQSTCKRLNRCFRPCGCCSRFPFSGSEQWEPRDRAPKGMGSAGWETKQVLQTESCIPRQQHPPGHAPERAARSCKVDETQPRLIAYLQPIVIIAEYILYYFKSTEIENSFFFFNPELFSRPTGYTINRTQTPGFPL